MQNFSQNSSQSADVTPSPSVSFEFFPPKTDALESALFRAVERLAPLAPDFVSVTYGAGGSTRTRTHDIVTRLLRDHELPAAAHLTCVGATRQEIDKIARAYWDAGIRHIVALRGDPPADSATSSEQNHYQPTPGGYDYAVDLVAGLKQVAPFEISVAAYPETHPEARSAEDDLENLRHKLDAGATRAITQFFFDNDAFYRFRDKATAKGITAPLIPGILPVTNFKRTLDFAARCNTSVPESYHNRFAGFEDKSADEKRAIAEDVAATQCADLQQNGVNHFHFYTLNRAELVIALCNHLGVETERLPLAEPV